MKYCDVCQGEKKVRLAYYPEISAIDLLKDDAPPSPPQPGWKEFDCPQCCMVPFRRVRATKVTTAYDAEVYGRMQMPIERTLAARFGEYLMREGLIRFTSSGSADLGATADKIAVTAHLGVVSREDVRRSGAVEEVALSPAPPLPRRLRERARLSDNAVAWSPPASPTWKDDEVVTDEFDEPKDAIDARFSGLEIR